MFNNAIGASKFMEENPVDFLKKLKKLYKRISIRKNNCLIIIKAVMQ